ncbi:unnamed protein product [Victoria cruziana]
MEETFGPRELSTKMSSRKGHCTVEFDGASKGNPGKSGAGAVLRDGKGDVIWKGHEGLGYSTNNQSEYKGAIIGMKKALEHGYDRIRLQGDSQLVTKQLDGSWRTRNENLTSLNKEASFLRDQFNHFETKFVPRASNYEADAEANKGAGLEKGQSRQYYY